MGHCLIVDDDEYTREYVTELVGRMGLSAETAVDGVEAAARLDEKRFDALILDLDLPNMPGEAVLHELVTSHQRPASIVVISGYPERICKWIAPDVQARFGITAVLDKPLMPTDVRNSLGNVIGSSMAAKAVNPGAVLIAGAGLWADALSRVATRGGGTLLHGRSREEALAAISEHHPAAIVAGPPISDPDLIQFCFDARAASPSTTILAAVGRADPELRKALLDAGVRKVCVVPNTGGDLAVAMVNAAHLNTRKHARVPISSNAFVETRVTRMRGVTKDVSEGGLCLERVTDRVARGPARVEFELPGDTSPIIADTEVVWSGGDTGEFRAGVRFAGISAGDLTRIRTFVTKNTPLSMEY